MRDNPVLSLVFHLGFSIDNAIRIQAELDFSQSEHIKHVKQCKYLLLINNLSS